MRKCNGYEILQIGNMDEISMNFDMPATHTVRPTGEKTVIMKTTGNEKNHFNVVLACLVNGSKLNPFLAENNAKRAYSIPNRSSCS